jgi:hypothetical protein
MAKITPQFLTALEDILHMAWSLFWGKTRLKSEGGGGGSGDKS